MTGRCATCGHFEPPDKFDAGYERGYGVCSMAYSDSEPCRSDSLAVAYDTEGYHAWLRVSPDFGCVQWQAVAAEETR